MLQAQLVLYLLGYKESVRWCKCSCGSSSPCTSIWSSFAEWLLRFIIFIQTRRHAGINFFHLDDFGVFQISDLNIFELHQMFDFSFFGVHFNLDLFTFGVHQIFELSRSRSTPKFSICRILRFIIAEQTEREADILSAQILFCTGVQCYFVYKIVSHCCDGLQNSPNRKFDGLHNAWVKTETWKSPKCYISDFWWTTQWFKSEMLCTS